MKRRQFITQAGLGLAAAGALMGSVRAEELPSIKWRIASSFPKNLDILFLASTHFAKRMHQLSQGKFEIQAFSAGEIVPGAQVFDAVQQGTVEMGHSATYYVHGKNKALSIDTTLPFGLTARQQSAWLFEGGGLALLRELFAKYNIVNFPAGNTGTQMGGWFRKEVNTLADLKGLKMRIPGFGGEILSRLGVVTQNIPLSDIYSSLEKGTIDATEFVGPHDDEKLGLQAVAPYYYYPGFWEGSAGVSYLINKDAWDKLPEIYQQMIELVSTEMHVLLQAKYDASNPRALATLVKNGAKLKGFSKEIMQAAYDTAQIIYAEESEKNPDFKKIYTHWNDFHKQEYQWFRVAEASFTNFMYSQVGRK